MKRAVNFVQPQKREDEVVEELGPDMYWAIDFSIYVFEDKRKKTII